jgi:hypothetical protein
MARWIWNGMVTMMRRTLNRRKMKTRNMRRRIRMRMIAKNLGRLARERWLMHWLMMLIPW